MLVDDELSTGRTALNTIGALHALGAARPVRARRAGGPAIGRRPTAGRGGWPPSSAARIDVVALAQGGVAVPDRRPSSAGPRWRRRLACPPIRHGRAPRTARAHAPRWTWPGRPACREAAGTASTRADRGSRCTTRPPGGGRRAGSGLRPDAPAGAGAGHRGADVRARCGSPLALPRGCAAARSAFSTDDPVAGAAVDDPGYPIRQRLDFPAHDASGRRSRPSGIAYNVVAGQRRRRCGRRDRPGHRRRRRTRRWRSAPGVAQSVTGCAPARRVLLARAAGRRPGGVASHGSDPLRGPAFGSYPPDEVAWLLTDLSAARPGGADRGARGGDPGRRRALRRVAADRVPARAPDYQALFEQVLDGRRGPARARGRRRHRTGAGRARPRRGAGVAGPGRHADRHPDAPLGRGSSTACDLPHYAVSHRAGPGHRRRSRCATWPPTTTRARWCSSTAGPARARSPASSPRRSTACHGRRTGVLRPDLAVLADPGHCVRTFGTRDDFLIPSACLNSTVSGLVSPHRAQPRPDRPGRVPRREVLRRAGRPRTCPARSSTRSATGSTTSPTGTGATGHRGRVRPGGRPGPAGPRSSGSAPSTASTTVNFVKPGRRRDDPGAAAPGAVADPGPRPGRGAPTSRTCCCSPSSGACPSRSSRTCRTAAWGSIHPRYTRGATGSAVRRSVTRRARSSEGVG